MSMTLKYPIGSKGMAVKTTVGLVVVILVIFGITAILYFTGWGPIRDWLNPDSAFACEVGLPTCKRVQATEAATGLVAAIKCAYYRCTEGCDSPNINYLIKNHEGHTLRCKEDLCLPYKDKDNKVCGKGNKMFSVFVNEKSVLATSLFFDKKFDEIKVEKTCEATKPITLEEKIFKTPADKDKCKEKECGIPIGVYYLWSEKGRTATCQFDKEQVITIPSFTFSIQPTTLTDKSEFTLTFPDIHTDAVAIKLIHEDKELQTYRFDRNSKSIKLTVGEAIPARSGSLRLEAFKVVYDSKGKEYNNLVGVSIPKPVTIEVKKAS